MAIVQYSLKAATSALQCKCSNRISFASLVSAVSIFEMRPSEITSLRFSHSRFRLGLTTSKNSSSCFFSTCDAAPKGTHSSRHVKHHAECLTTQLKYMASPWTFAVWMSCHMPVQCQNIPATICICSGTVLGCHEAVVHTLTPVSPEVVEKTFFLFSSGEWEAGCDASSPRDTPGVKLNRTKTTMQCQKRLAELSEM